jgi:hypothetical protein
MTKLRTGSVFSMLNHDRKAWLLTDKISIKRRTPKLYNREMQALQTTNFPSTGYTSKGLDIVLFLLTQEGRMIFTLNLSASL